MDVPAYYESFGSSCQYERATIIGSGSFGIVCLAKIAEHADYVGDVTGALKVVRLDSDILEKEGLLKMTQLKRRLTLLLALKHDHVVPYHKATFFQQDGLQLELLMDYYSGGDLSKMLKGNALLNDESAVLCYATQIADGLTYLHARQIIHGDIKPANILVRPSRHMHHILAIGDSDDLVQIQGTATSMHDITHLRGTLRYMSPEMIRRYVQFAAEEVVGRPTDVWSLGCVILDLANACSSNAARDLYKSDTGEKLEIESGFQWNSQYINFISTGWTPFIADSINDTLASCIRPCFAAVEDRRIKAANLLENLVKKTSVSTLLVSEEAKRSCVCTSRVPNPDLQSIRERNDSITPSQGRFWPTGNSSTFKRSSLTFLTAESD